MRRGSPLSRAAILAGATALAGVGCGSSEADTTHDETYEHQDDTQGDEDAVDDMGDGTGDGYQESDPEPDIQAMPYGAPPAPVRRVLV